MCRRHSRAEVGCLSVSGFGALHFVARPVHLALFALTGCWGIGRAEQQRRWWQLLRAAPASWWALRGPIARRQPHLPQALDGGPLPPPGGRGRRVDGPQPWGAVRANWLGQRLAGGPLRRQALFRQPPALTLEPRRRSPGWQPRWRGGGQPVQRRAERGADALEAIESWDSGQDMRRVGALAALRFAEPLRATQR